MKYDGAIQPRGACGDGGGSDLGVSVAAADCFAHGKAELLQWSVSKSYGKGGDAHRPPIGEGPSLEGEVRWQTGLHGIGAQECCCDKYDTCCTEATITAERISIIT